MDCGKLTRIDEERNPTDNDEETRRKVISDNVEGDFSRQDHFETGHGVIHPNGHIVGLIGSANEM